MKLFNFDFDNSRMQPYKKWISINIPLWLLNRKEVSKGAKLLYGRLLMYVGKNWYAYPSQLKLAQDLGVSEETIGRYLKELKELKLIEIKHQGEHKTNRYYILNHYWHHSERGSYFSYYKTMGGKY